MNVYYIVFYAPCFCSMLRSKFDNQTTKEIAWHDEDDEKEEEEGAWVAQNVDTRIDQVRWLTS
jgi:hypothetical protein